MEGEIIGAPEAPVVETPNLANFKKLTSRYKEVNSLNKDVSLQDFEDACDSLGASPKKILKADGHIDFENLISFTSDLVNAKRDKTNEYMVRTGQAKPLVRDPDTEISDLEAFLKIKKFVEHTEGLDDWKSHLVEQNYGYGDKKEIRNVPVLEYAEESIRGYTKEAVIAEGIRCYEQDAIEQSNFFVDQDVLERSDFEHPRTKSAVEILRKIAISQSSPDLQRQYTSLLQDVEGEKYTVYYKGKAATAIIGGSSTESLTTSLLKVGAGEFFDEVQLTGEQKSNITS